MVRGGGGNGWGDTGWRGVGSGLSPHVMHTGHGGLGDCVGMAGHDWHHTRDHSARHTTGHTARWHGDHPHHWVALMLAVYCLPRVEVLLVAVWGLASQCGHTPS